MCGPEIKSTHRLHQNARASVMFGQVTNIHNLRQVAILPNEEDEDIMFSMNLYLKRDQLPSSLGCFNSCVPREIMRVQTNLGIEGCEVRDIIGTVMVIHMDTHDKLMEGLLNVYFLDSLHEPANLRLLMKSSKFHIRSLSDLYSTSIPGFVSHPELQYNTLVKVSDTVSTMICRVAASHPSMNRIHIDMLAIKAYLLQETNDKVVVLYHGNDICVPTVKHDVFITPDKRIQLATIERERQRNIINVTA
jgi:hypothetical protein